VHQVAKRAYSAHSARQSNPNRVRGVQGVFTDWLGNHEGDVALRRALGDGDEVNIFTPIALKVRPGFLCPAHVLSHQAATRRYESTVMVLHLEIRQVRARILAGRASTSSLGIGSKLEAEVVLRGDCEISSTLARTRRVVENVTAYHTRASTISRRPH